MKNPAEAGSVAQGLHELRGGNFAAVFGFIVRIVSKNLVGQSQVPADGAAVVQTCFGFSGVVSFVALIVLDQEEQPSFLSLVATSI